MRPRFAIAPVFVCLAAVLTNARANAQQAPQQVKGWALDTFDPSERGGHWFAVDSLDFRGQMRAAGGVVAEWAYKPLTVQNLDGSERAAVVRDQLVLHPGASLTLLNSLRLGIDVPVAVFSDGDSSGIRNYRLAAPDSAALGDVRLSADLRLFGSFGNAVTASLGTSVFLPSGSQDGYMGEGSTRIAPRVQLAGEAGSLVWAARIGALVRTSDDPILGQSRGQALTFGAAAGAHVLQKKLALGPEIYGAVSLSNPDEATTAFELLFGAHYDVARDWRLGLAGGPGLTHAYGEPLVRVIASIEFAPHVEAAPAKGPEGPADKDADGIADDKDACPDEAGLKTDNPETNGCPPPRDRDKDGVPDRSDACPDLAGPPNDKPKENGCPPDSDGDGVRDPVDACPQVPGVEQADPAQNGCPPDSDRDGVIDEQDACPDVPGIKTSDPQTNGCPDPDRDKDKIPNDVDACPDEPGAPNTDPTKNGCPKAFVKAGQIQITDQVKFKTGSAEILPGKDSAEVLTAVAKVMGDHPEIAHVTVEGHTDNRGDAKANKRLSEQRAASVLKWLVAHGVDATKLSSVGWGQERPLESNATEAGRKSNRRVEFHIENAKKE